MSVNDNSAPMRRVWRDLLGSRFIQAPHGTVVCEMHDGEFSGTIETDCETPLPNDSMLGPNYRWRVFVNGVQAAVGCCYSPVGAIAAAERFIELWPKYPPNAQSALLSSAR